MPVKLQVKGVKKLRNIFKAMEEAVDPKMKVAATMGWKDVMDHFDKEEDSKGRKWMRFQRGKSSSRPSKQGGTKLLQDKGRLRNSIRWIVKKAKAIIYTNMVYARTHNDGDKGRNIPRRQFMFLSKDARRKIVEWMRKGVRKAMK